MRILLGLILLFTSFSSLHALDNNQVPSKAWVHSRDVNERDFCKRRINLRLPVLPETPAHSDIALQKVVKTKQTLQDVKSHVMSLLIRGVTPSSILLILDNDGTLTNELIPAHEPAATSVRAESNDFIKNMIKEGVKIVIASAWDEFPVTLRTLTSLDLKDDLGFDEHATKEIDERLPSGRSVTGFVSGRVCSVKDTEGAYINSRLGIDTRYFRAKALTPYFVFSREEIKAFKYVIFADDSASNISVFFTDIESLGLSVDAKVALYSLVPPNLEPKN